MELSLNASLVASKFRALYDLTKFRLTFLVVFSAGIGYALGNQGEFSYSIFSLFCLSSFLIVAAANTLNQIAEVRYDAMMKRTRNRPLPTSSLSKTEAHVFAIVCIVVGSVLMILSSNAYALGLSLISLILYAFVYTPLKRKSPINVFIGAIPGALPPMIGWVAVTGAISIESSLLFLIQFIWQFPHFWAIAWVLHEDYKKAGFKMLPGNGERDIKTAFQLMIYTLLLIPLGLLPSLFRITGYTSGIIAVICGILFLITTFYHMKEGSTKTAKNIMFSSFIYLPIIQIAYLIDKL